MNQRIGRPGGERSFDFSWRPPHRIVEQIVGWRARQISDPVERLRYLQRSAGGASKHRHSLGWRRRTAIFLLGFLLIPPPTASDANISSSLRIRETDPVPGEASAEPEPPRVWLVERTPDYEVYSNGLRIETRFTVSCQPRKYPIYSEDGSQTEPIGWGTEPVGIVYHATESDQAPFEEEQTRKLKYLGEALLRYVRQHKSYHYVIDRFGRIFRIVDEGSSANHAGYSVWASGGRAFVNLNRSFLGIALEAQTQHGDEVRGPAITPAQIHAARVLTEMLRSRYRISARNCVTHAQVSVSPAAARIGYHTDWASDFPFDELGLPDNYALPPTSLYGFGFGYDSLFEKAAGASLRNGLQRAEERLRQDASASGLTVPAYRARLQQRYRRLIAALNVESALEENDDEKHN